MEEERVMKKNKLFVGVICLLVLVSITGCGKKTNLSSKKQSDNTETKTEVKAKCSYYKCLSKMSLSNTVDELNNIVGIEAKSVETTVENMEKYEYDFGNDKKITVTLFSGKVSSITMAYDKKELKNSKVTLDNLADVKAKINDGVSYADFKNAVGGVDGTLYELGSWNKYVWVAGDGSSNVTASFGKDGNLKFFSGLGFKG